MNSWSTVQIIYVLGSPAALVFPVYYTCTARWWGNREGRLFFAMSFLPFCLYAATVLFLVVPESPWRNAIRVVLVCVASSVSWGTLLVYRRIRREGLAERRALASRRIAKDKKEVKDEA